MPGLGPAQRGPRVLEPVHDVVGVELGAARPAARAVQQPRVLLHLQHNTQLLGSPEQNMFDDVKKIFCM